jgi:hypothetical protein
MFITKEEGKALCISEYITVDWRGRTIFLIVMGQTRKRPGQVDLEQLPYPERFWSTSVSTAHSDSYDQKGAD